LQTNPINQLLADQYAVSNISDGTVKDSLVSQCKNQLIKSSDQVQSFSFLGVTLITCFTVLIVALSLSLEPLVQLFRRRGGKINGTIQVARQADDKFYLLSMALDAAGYGDWKYGPWGIPVVKQQVDFVRPIKEGELYRYPRILGRDGRTPDIST